MPHATTDRGVALIITTAPVEYSSTLPARCDPKRYHIFRWHGGPIAPPGLRCECGALTDPPNAYDEQVDGPPWVSA